MPFNFIMIYFHRIQTRIRSSRRQTVIRGDIETVTICTYVFVDVLDLRSESRIWIESFLTSICVEINSALPCVLEASSCMLNERTNM